MAMVVQEGNMQGRLFTRLEKINYMGNQLGKIQRKYIVVRDIYRQSSKWWYRYPQFPPYLPLPSPFSHPSPLDPRVTLSPSPMTARPPWNFPMQVTTIWVQKWVVMVGQMAGQYVTCGNLTLGNLLKYRQISCFVQG